MCVSCFDFMNNIETIPFCASSWNLADKLTMMKGWPLLILESNFMVTNDMYANNLVSTIETNPRGDARGLSREYVLRIPSVS